MKEHLFTVTVKTDQTNPEYVLGLLKTIVGAGQCDAQETLKENDYDDALAAVNLNITIKIA